MEDVGSHDLDTLRTLTYHGKMVLNLLVNTKDLAPSDVHRTPRYMVDNVVTFI